MGYTAEKVLNSSGNSIFLNLRSELIGDPGATALAKALEKNSTLTSLELMGNQISYTIVVALEKALEKNKELNSINENI